MHLQFVNNPTYRDRGPTANQSGEVIKMKYINIYGNENSTSKIYCDMR